LRFLFELPSVQQRLERSPILKSVADPLAVSLSVVAWV
jgi:hypothetical protein